jgi:hypothetical protein
MLTGIDNAFSSELYYKYRCNNHTCRLHITANHVWSKYTYIDEEVKYIGTFKTMEELFEAQTKRFIHSEPILGEVLILTHTQWLDNTFPRWKKIKAYQHW